MAPPPDSIHYPIGSARSVQVPSAHPRDYLEGSRVVSLFRKSAEGLFQTAARLSRRAVSWIGVEGSFRQTIPPRTLCAILAAAIVANGLTLFLARKEIILWGIILRGVGFGVALLGLRCPCDWESVQGSSVLMRLLRKGK